VNPFSKSAALHEQEGKKVAKKISVQEARNGAARDAQWVDVRSSSEFAAGHIPGTTNVPFDQLDARLDDISKERPVLVVCESGQRAAIAANLLANCGREVLLLDGGTSAWRAAGNPVVRNVKSRWSLERQVRLIAGLLVAGGVGLGVFLHQAFLGVAAFVGLGLTFAGLTDFCPMAVLLERLPWNQAAKCPTERRGKKEAMA
jgi:rhodanese-related sulfurtransferase